MKKVKDSKKKKENPKKPKGPKNLGYKNSWDEIPKEVKRCEQLKHKEETSKTEFNCVTRHECPKCHYFYLVDSSD